MFTNRRQKNKTLPQPVISDRQGKIYNIPYLEAAGMEGGNCLRLSPDELIKLPFGSELFMLPRRNPVSYNPGIGDFVTKEQSFAVAAFVSPGYTVTHSAAYTEKSRTSMLPLFSYAAVAFYKNDFYVAATRVDWDRRQDLRLMDEETLHRCVRRFIKLFPNNRLVRHLKDCALCYGCPAAKNFFLSRYEAPLPTSPACNAQCAGCISYQPEKLCQITQPRIKFVPRPEEIREIALFHISNVKGAIVSFGQGCEGEPLLVSDTIEKSIKLIRQATGRGTINLNTNASKPKAVSRLFDAGLDTMRVSLNSASEEYYNRYHAPRGYEFRDVMKSIEIAGKKRGFVSLNYLVMPGFTDSIKEFEALRRLLAKYTIGMIQWRNLNFDPLGYFRILRFFPERDAILGIRNVIGSVRKGHPRLITGYFNPSRQKITSWGQVFQGDIRRRLDLSP